MYFVQFQVPYVIAPRREGDIGTVFGDASLAEKELKWKAQRDLEEMCKFEIGYQLPANIYHSY